MQIRDIDRRALAGVIDLALLYLPWLAFLMALLRNGELARGNINVVRMVLCCVVLFGLVLAFGASEVVGTATLGKRALKLEVRLATGQPAPIRCRIHRALCKWVPMAGVFGGTLLAVPFAVAGHASLAAGICTLLGLLTWGLTIDFAFVFGPRRLALHDRIAGTMVAHVAGSLDSDRSPAIVSHPDAKRPRD